MFDVGRVVVLDVRKLMRGVIENVFVIAVVVGEVLMIEVAEYVVAVICGIDFLAATGRREIGGGQAAHAVVGVARIGLHTVETLRQRGACAEGVIGVAVVAEYSARVVGEIANAGKTAVGVETVLRAHADRRPFLDKIANLIVAVTDETIVARQSTCR